MIKIQLQEACRNAVSSRSHANIEIEYPSSHYYVLRKMRKMMIESRLEYLARKD